MIGVRSTRAPGIKAFEFYIVYAIWGGLSGNTGATAIFSIFLFEPYFERYIAGYWSEILKLFELETRKI